MYVASSTFAFGDIETAVRELSSIGIRALEAYETGIRPGYWHLRVEERSPDEFRQLRSWLDDEGVALSAISGHVPLIGDDDALIRASLSHLEKCMTAAALLGCPVVVTASGGGQGSGEAERDWEDLSTRVSRLSERAGDHGVRIAFEPHYGEFVATTADLERLLQAVPSPHLGVNYDAAGLQVAGEDLAASIDRVAERTIHTHIRDIADGDLQDVPQLRRECVPGTGAIAFPSIVQGLLDAGYEGALSIELHKVCEGRLADHVSAGEYLEQLITNAEGTEDS